MKKIKLLILFFSTLLSCGVQSATLHDAQGHAFSSASLKGKWVVINYWADWCEACAEEIPELNRFYRHEAGKNVVLYGFNYDQLTGDSLQQAMHESKIAFPVLVDDPQTAWSLRDVDVLPTTFIIDPNGRMVREIVGTNTEESLQQTIAELSTSKS